MPRELTPAEEKALIQKKLRHFTLDKPVEHWLNTGNRRLNAVLGSEEFGLAYGKMMEIFGPNCLASDTHIMVDIWSKGRKINHKATSIERLYERFNQTVVVKDRRGRNTRTVKNAGFFVPSVDKNGVFLRNRVLSVDFAGNKECFEIVTKTGMAIKASKKHRFLTPSGYKELCDLKVGDKVLMHFNKYEEHADKKDKKKRPVELRLDFHPMVQPKLYKKPNIYHHSVHYKRSHLVVEAKMNNLTLETYLKKLDSKQVDGLVFLPKGIHVHHKNRNNQDDVPENLEALSNKEHGKRHSKERSERNLRRVAVTDSIKSIRSVGILPTYDVAVAKPNNNFVANKFVVHNSHGKTMLALLIAALAQADGAKVAWVDLERSFDKPWVEAQGVKYDNVFLARVELVKDGQETRLQTAQEVFEEVEEWIAIKHKNNSDGKILLVVDSLAALMVEEEAEAGIGGQNMRTNMALPSFLSKTLKKWVAMAANTNTLMIFINQIRAAIGQWGTPEYAPGGNATKHYCACRVTVRRVKGGRLKQGPKIVGLRGVIKNVKNKVGGGSIEGCEVGYETLFGRRQWKFPTVADVRKDAGEIEE